MKHVGGCYRAKFAPILGCVTIAKIVFILSLSPTYAAEPQTLEEAWVEAYQNNPSLEAQRAKLRAIDEQVNQALSHWRPTVTLNANAGRIWQQSSSRNGIPASNYANNTDSYGAQITQPIFRGFRTLAETEAAEKQVLSGRAELESAEQQLLLETGKAYLDVMRDENILNINRDEERILNKKLEEATERARLGDLTRTDVRQARTRLAKAEVTRLQAENALTADRAAFLRLVGNEAATLKQPKLEAGMSSENLEEVLHRAETVNPTVIAAHYAVEEAKAEVDLNKGSLLPEVNLVGSTSNAYGQSVTFPGREKNTQVMLQVSMPLYDGGADYSKIRAARQTATQHRMEMEEARHKARETAQNAWQQLRTAEAAIKADQAGIEAAADALEGVKAEARVGGRTTLDVLNAEQELLEAKIDMANARHDRDYAVLQIKAAVGDLTARTLKLPLEVYDPKQYYDDNAGKLIGFGTDDDYVVGRNNKRKSAEH